MRKGFRFASFLLALCMLCALLGGCMGANVTAPQPAEATPQATSEPSAAPEQTLDEDGSYTSKDDVARAAGWSGGSLEKYLPGMCIGGDRFGNREGLLPDAPGRSWTECDVNTLGASSRGAERIVFSNDGLIYYTGDHYETFELLYGTP